MSDFSFNELKRNTSGHMDKLTKELTKLNTPTYASKDDRLWTCQTDKSGNGYAVIRFLPAPGGEDIPFVRMFTHGFQGTGGWYIENSLTTIGQQDPIGELNTRLWNSGIDADKETVRKQKRQLNYYSNIYIVKDPANPANEGTVKLFRYGKKIWDKLNDAMNPSAEFEDEKPLNPFDLWEGANFKLKIRKVDGYANYDKCEFDSPAPLSKDDDEMEKIWKSEYSLTELVDPKNFKSYDDLKARLERALGTTVQGSAPKTEQFAAAAPQFKAAQEPRAASVASTADMDDDEDISFFKGLVDDE